MFSKYGILIKSFKILIKYPKHDKSTIDTCGFFIVPLSKKKLILALCFLDKILSISYGSELLMVVRVGQVYFNCLIKYVCKKRN